MEWYNGNMNKRQEKIIASVIEEYTNTAVPVPSDMIAKKYISATGSVLGANGTSNAGTSNPLVIPAKEAQAIWNYKTLEEDKSAGIHNPGYAKALLKNSIQALQ